MNCNNNLVAKNLIGKNAKLVFLYSYNPSDFPELDELTDSEWRLLVRYHQSVPFSKRPKAVYRDKALDGLWVPVYLDHGVKYKLLQNHNLK